MKSIIVAFIIAVAIVCVSYLLIVETNNEINFDKEPFTPFIHNIEYGQDSLDKYTIIYGHFKSVRKSTFRAKRGLFKIGEHVQVLPTPTVKDTIFIKPKKRRYE